MAVSRELIEFDRGDTTVVEARIASLAEGSWINLEPILPDEDLDQLQAQSTSALVRVFSPKGRPIPFGTIVAERDSFAVGLEHGQGKRMVLQLSDQGIRVPKSWRQQQDNARRGIVYQVPRDETPLVIVSWILDAAAATAVIPLRGRWSAMVATPS